MMKGNFILRLSKAETVLSGKFMADDAFKYSCPEILFNFKKSDEKETDK